jgi:broad specificity phosphatase PhoE
VLIMGSIYLVRHAQAAFGTADYDRLTQIGFAQAQRLGRYFAARNLRFDAVYTGTLRRHRETALGILDHDPAAGSGASPPAAALECRAGLDEYRPEALMASLAAAQGAPAPQPPGAAPAATRADAALMREHFRRLREALLAWTEDRIEPEGMPPWRDFQQAAVEALVEARRRHPQGNVLIVSSGGPIGAIVAAALESPPQIAIDLNLRIRNTALTEFATSARRHQLLSFNALPHLEPHADPSLLTYA